MRNTKKGFCHFSKAGLFCAGLVGILLFQLPFWILGQNAVIPYYDQLDGEMIAYIYQAKYLFSPGNIIPEFLNGAPKTALCPPAPLAVLFFRLLPPRSAYFLLQLLGQLTGYAGMFLLSDLLTGRPCVNVITALAYAFLPFLPLYGLSQYGMPLAAYCLLLLHNRKHKVSAYLYLAFYASMSSLALCGFIWLGILFCANLFLLIRGRGRQKTAYMGSFLLMSGIYLAENLPLLEGLFQTAGEEISHRSEFVLADAPFFTSFKSFLLQNIQHCGDNHIFILIPTAVVLVLGLLTYRNWESSLQKSFRILLGVLASVLSLCVLAALWGTEAGIRFRNLLGSFGSFQMDRLLWLSPMLWYTVLALCLHILLQLTGKSRYIGILAGTVSLALLSFFNLKACSALPCVRRLLDADYPVISYSDYYGIGIFDQVEAYIQDTENQEKEEYKAASLGIDPAAALYHGFYCVDGYSNNYPLSYKHAFREVIAPELEANDWLRDYYDTWGNRCYLFSHEIPGYFNIQKGSFWYNDLRIDTSALYRLGCRYIFSAAYIVNAEEEGLELLREEPFSTPDSYYNIYLYQILP